MPSRTAETPGADRLHAWIAETIAQSPAAQWYDRNHETVLLGRYPTDDNDPLVDDTDYNVHATKPGSPYPQLPTVQIPGKLETLTYPTHLVGRIGQSGWNFVEGHTPYVCLEVDLAGDGHQKGVAPDELLVIEEDLERVAWAEARRSTGGAGLHIRVPLKTPVPSPTRREYVATIKRVLRLLGEECTLDLAEKVDQAALGRGNLWLWADRMRSESFALVSEATEELDLDGWAPEAAEEKAEEEEKPAPQAEAASSGLDLKEVVAALDAISADDYNVWLRVGLALYNTDPALLPIWDWWSQRGDTYAPGKCAEKWSSFGHYKGDKVTLASVYYLAQRQQEDWIKSVREVAAEHSEPREPVVMDLLDRRDIMNVIAASKLGKTYFLLQLALSVASGVPWLDLFRTRKGRVLIVDNECHPDTIVGRIRHMIKAMGLDESVRDNIDIATLRGNLVTLDRLCGRIAHFPPETYSLIIVDTLYRVLPKNTDENSNADVTGLYNMLDRAAARQGRAIAIVHHTSKGVQTNKAVTDVGSGAGAQSRAADCHLILRPHKSKGTVTMEAVVRAHPSPDEVALVREFPLWRIAEGLDPGQLRGKRSTMTRDEFLEWLPDGEHPKVDLVERLRSEAGVARDTAKKLFNDAIEAGEVIDLGKPGGRGGKKLVKKAE